MKINKAVADLGKRFRGKGWAPLLLGKKEEISSLHDQVTWQELHASPHIEHFPILSYPYISIYGYVLSIYGYVG